MRLSPMTQENNAVVVLPILPLKNTVLFPQLFLPLSVGRPQSLAAVEAALATEEKTFVGVAQRAASVETPRPGRSLHRRHARRRQEGGPRRQRRRGDRPGPGARGHPQGRTDGALSQG